MAQYLFLLLFLQSDLARGTGLGEFLAPFLQRASRLDDLVDEVRLRRRRLAEGRCPHVLRSRTENLPSLHALHEFEGHQALALLWQEPAVAQHG